MVAVTEIGKTKVRPYIKLDFTNGIDKSYPEGKGFQIELAGNYDAIIALMDEMKKAIQMFKEEDSHD